MLVRLNNAIRDWSQRQSTAVSFLVLYVIPFLIGAVFGAWLMKATGLVHYGLK